MSDVDIDSHPIMRASPDLRDLIASVVGEDEDARITQDSESIFIISFPELFQDLRKRIRGIPGLRCALIDPYIAPSSGNPDKAQLTIERAAN